MSTFTSIEAVRLTGIKRDMLNYLCKVGIVVPTSSRKQGERGHGVRLFETAFDLLGTDRPLLSVSENSKPKFSRLFSHFGFAQEAVYVGRYLPEVEEISYNGLLDWPMGLLSNWPRAPRTDSAPVLSQSW